LDGDGTIHYFAKDADRDIEVQRETGASELIAYYYDEDGLGLKINEYATDYYAMSDDYGNTWVFVRGPLLWITDSDGNKTQIYYTKNGAATTNSYPTGSGDRIEKITQRNIGASEVTIATFSYKSHTPSSASVANYIDTITDYAGNRYSFEYQQGKLTSIQYNDQEIAQYIMRKSGAWLQNELIGIKDVEAGYSLNFTYENHKVSSVEEATSKGTSAKIVIDHLDDRRTMYRDTGADRTSDTYDDIITYYGFDYYGRTVNAYTTDNKGNILGAANSAYSGTGSTERTNNRTLRTASIGVAAQQELRNFGFESTATDVAWQLHKSSSDKSATVNTVINGDKPRTGAKSFKSWISPNKTGLAGASKPSNLLQANTTYILSAYVNTSQATSFAGTGMYLQVTDTAGNTWKSPCINYKTSTLVDDGWVRLVLVFQTKVKCNHTVAIYNDGVGGATFADDMQLEWAKAPIKDKEMPSTQAVSNVNLLENGSLQFWGYGWTMNAGASYVTGSGVNSTSEYACSIKVTGNPKSNHYASQTVTVNQPGSQTYVLSGWAKANSVPDNKMDGDPEKDKEAAAKDKNKQFGLRAVLTYSDNAKEYHYVPFNPELPGWQFASLAVVPKQPSKTVSTICIECAYEKNANTAWFDDLSLVREAAQTMRYDDEGNLVSVTTPGIDPNTDTYKNGNLIKSVTGGNGTYTYTYDQTHKHRLTSVTNDVVTQTMGYDSSGNVTSTTLKSNTSGYNKTLDTTATYTSNNNLVASVKDPSGQTESYTYSGKQSVMTGQATSIKDASGNVTTTTYNNMGRVAQKGFANHGKLQYNYQEGILSSVVRTDASGNAQTYAYDHDSFGNLIGVSIGGMQLGNNQYGEKNGNLLEQVYGNGDSVSFQYDNLNRVTKSTYSSGRTLDYTYTGDGQLYSITDNNATSDQSDDTAYFYTYDTLGRIVNCQVQQGIQTLLQVHWEYDDFSRVKSQGWQMGASSYKETFSYSEKDGTLTGIATEGGGNSLHLAYDPLQRLASVSNNIYTRAYTYKDVSSTKTTSQVQKLQYTGLPGLLNGLAYNSTYNALGNIASVGEDGTIADTFTYDAMGQLTSARLGNNDIHFTYTYDGVGNLQEVVAHGLYHSSDNYTNTYTYGNEDWKDLLTAFNGEEFGYEGQYVMPLTYEVTGTPISGNPISYFNGTRWSFDWAEGRNLSTALHRTRTQDNVLDFSYDANGLRTSKQVEVKTYEFVPTHNYVETVVAPTCTEKGYTLHECACGDSYRSNEIAALGHNYVQDSSSATISYTCSRCGDTYTEHTHSYTSKVVAPTCTVDGYTLHTCACGYSYRSNTVVKLGHNYIKTSEDLQYAYFRCTRCGDTYKSGIAVLPVDPKPPISTISLDEDESSSTILPSTCPNQRVLKSTVTEEHSYIYASGKLLRETITGNGATKTLDFRYDNMGFPYALVYHDGSTTATYYYITNLQGDVMYLVDASGNQVAAYSYDPYGKVLTSRGVMAEINPLRYRGYYQDNETGFYYLQSRYYDPAICRFINADSYTSTGQGYLGYNAFAYCNNDPVNRTDADGEFFDIIFDVISIGFSIADVVQNPTDPWAWIGLAGDVIDVVVPFVSGVGETTKAVGAVADVADVMDDVHDVAKVADNVDDAYDAMKAADGINDTLGSVKDASKLDLDSACFIAGTLVLTADGYQNIEDVQVGDYVWAWDEETGDIALKQVVETYIREKADLVHIFAAGEEIVTTTEHPFYSPVQGWTAASDLRAGDVLLLVNGEYVVVEKVQHEQQECSVKVYNFQVEDFHTYYVSDSGVLVHNACSAPRFDENQQALLELAKEKEKGITMDDAKILNEWGEEYGFKNNRIDTGHASGKNPVTQRPHFHIGPYNHIPIIEMY
jgi:RHS repeat-associated protein